MGVKDHSFGVIRFCLFVCLFNWCLFACFVVLIMCCIQIHPIFMLSIADFILGALWMAGGGIWLSDDPYHFKSRFSRKNCFVILLATVVRGKGGCLKFH